MDSVPAPREGDNADLRCDGQISAFCANQARTSVMKDVAREAWRLAVEYRDQAANLGDPPNIGKKPPHVDEA